MNKVPQAIGPYSTHRKVGDYIFSSGQLPINPETNKIESTDVKEQIKQSLENVKAVLNLEGADLSQVIKTTILMSDISYFQDINEVYAGYFSEPYPARTAYQVKALPMGALVEVEVIAYLK